MNCKNCKSKKLARIFKLGNQPISSVFPTKKIKILKKYNLDLFKCSKCELVQFSKLAPLDDMYGETYGYRTSLSKLMIDHMKSKYEGITKKYKLKKNSEILDIGSNDGTFLNFFAKNKFNNLYAIDPSAKKFQKYYNNKIKTFFDYFSKKNIFHLNNSKKITFSLITSYAMFYDIEDPNSFCADISNLLKKDGIWVLEMSYFPLLLKNLTYDQICHEHVTYYTLSTFKEIINKHGMDVIDFSFNDINGGSIEIICSKKNSIHKTKTKKINQLLLEESKINNNSYMKFTDRVKNTKEVLNSFLSLIPRKDIIGYGASTKGNIVLNHCGIDNTKLNFICDANPYKFGRFTPGSNIKIISKIEMRKRNPKYLLVLIWSFRSEVILQEVDYIKKGGKLVFHLPIFHIVDKYNYKKYLNKNFTSLSYEI